LLHLSTIRHHYKMGFMSVVFPVEQFEDQIEDLTLSRTSKRTTFQLKNTVIAQQNEIKLLSLSLENKSQQLSKANHVTNQGKICLVTS
jgi:hypothetical protein